MTASTPSFLRRTLLQLATVTAASLFLLSGCCSLVPETRRLPSYINRIYIPEFRNLSREFGLQADLTPATVDRFLEDGRLDVVQNERADVRLEGKIVEFRELPGVLGGDRFPTVDTMQMRVELELWDPYDADRIAPLFRFEVPATIQYISDVRRSIAETRTEAKQRLMDAMAQSIVNAVMYGTPIPLEPTEQRGIERYRERKGPANYEPPTPQPRFPDPVDVEDVDL